MMYTLNILQIYMLIIPQPEKKKKRNNWNLTQDCQEKYQ